MCGKQTFRQCSIAVIVTGRQEEGRRRREDRPDRPPGFDEFLQRSLGRALAGREASVGCSVRMLRWFPQLAPPGSGALLEQGGGKELTDRQAELGVEVRNALAPRFGRAFDLVVFVDDLEHAFRARRREKFLLYREAIDRMLAREGRPDEILRRRASVHFLVNMVEAYFFADPATFRSVLGIDPPRVETLPSSESSATPNPEDIKHPKGQIERILGELGRSYHETDDGAGLLEQLDAEVVLADPDTCASLRTLFAWCWNRMGLERGEEFQLRAGRLDEMTAPQI